jgi:tetratricopeptide (TPR) repeat protein
LLLNISDVREAFGEHDEALKRAKQAEGIAQQLLAKNPDNPKFKDLVYDSAIRVGESAIRVGEYRKAIELDPRLAAPNSNLGLALRDQHKTDEAIAEYRKVIERDPRDAAPHFNLGSELK